jgi:hypothetical protein
MVKRVGTMVAVLLAVVVTAGCAAPATASEENVVEVPGVEPTAAGAAGWSAPDVTNDVATVSAAPSAETGMVGLSPRTTRGHVWAEPAIDGDTLALSTAVAALGDHVHLEVPLSGGTAGFIGYFCDDEFYLRATVCPNCGAERIEWGVSLLTCRACSTTFDLVSGYASGEGQGYPLGTIPYTVEGDSIELSMKDLDEAYWSTAAGRRTLFEEPELVDDDDRGDRSWPRCCVVR